MKNKFRRVLLAMAMSWVFSVTLGLLFAASASGHFSIRTLGLPGVVPVALIISTAIAIGMTPIALWSLRTGARNLYVYGPILWMLLAACDVLLIPRIGTGPWGLIPLAVLGLIVLDRIPATK